MSKSSDPLGPVIDNALDVHEATFKWGDASAADLIAAGVKHVGESPNEVKRWKDEDGNWVTNSVWDIIPDHMELPNAVRRLRNNADNVGGGQNKRDIIAYATWKYMTASGQFFKTTDHIVYYFYDDEKKVYRVSGDGNSEVTQEFRALVHELSGLATGQDGRSALAQIHDRASRQAPEREAHRFAAWDEDAETLYITDFDDGYYALNGHSVQHRDNGDDVFFLDFDGDPYSYLPEPDRADFNGRVPGELHKWHGQGDMLMRFFGNRTNFDPAAILSPEQQRLQMYLHLHAMAFIDFFAAKPITAFVGEKGSGKTVIQRSFGKFLFGAEWTESMMPSEREDFAAIVANRPLAFVDNFDQGVDWANDILASVATGSADIRRQLYTTMDMAKTNPDCFMAITSRDPPFRRDDVADRTIVFRVCRLENFIGMRGFLNPVVRNRDTLWSVYLDNLNDIVKGIQTTDIENMVSTHRMSDWAGFAKVAADVLGESGVEDMLEVMQSERALFALEDDSLFRTLREWLADEGPAVRGVKYTAGDLLDELNDYADDEGIEFTYNRAQTLGKRLGNVTEELDELFGFRVDDSGRTKKYEFIDPNDMEDRQTAFGYDDFDGDDTDDDGSDSDGADSGEDSPAGGAGGSDDQSASDESASADGSDSGAESSTTQSDGQQASGGGSQDDRMDQIRALVKDKHDDFEYGVPEDVIVTMMEGRGYRKEVVRDSINALLKKGEMYEPKQDDHYRPTY